MSGSALIVGYGSAGRRHARVLAGLGFGIGVVTRYEAEGQRCWRSLEDGLRECTPDYVVIANATGEHRASLSALAEAGFAGRVMVEKPLFAATAPIPPNRFAALNVAYNLRFHPALRRLAVILRDARILSAHAYVGQYLPSMRRGLEAGYRTNFRARAAEGGGVLRDFSHELDYLRWLFGDWRSIAATGGHVSALEIDADDLCAAVIAFERCPAVTLQMNYLDRRLRREIVVNCEGTSWRCDLAAGTLEGAGETERFAVASDDTTIAMHRAALEGSDGDLPHGADGLAVVEMVEAIERAMLERRWMDRLAA